VPADPGSKVRALADKRLAIDAVQREDLDASVVDELGKRRYRTRILVLEEAPSGCGEDNDWPAGVAVAFVFHRSAEMAAIFLVVGNMQLRQTSSAWMKRTASLSSSRFSDRIW
jgi:hypothetical protein